MKTVCFLLLVFCFFFRSQESLEKYPRLELIEIKQLDPGYKKQFDLSGIIEDRSTTLVIADKDWDEGVYEIEFGKQYWYIKNKISFNLNSSGNIDLEGIEKCGEEYFLINEADQNIYCYNTRTSGVNKLVLNYKEAKENTSKWLKNAGLEGIAIDSVNNIIYIAKERQPRFILAIDKMTLKFLDQFTIPEDDSNDISDLKYENGHLYILERNARLITKVDVKSKKVVAKVSYKHLCYPIELYEPTQYGMAEALLLKKDEVWVGIDNNGLSVSPYAKEKFKIEGSMPAILKFKRPKDF